MSLAKQMVLECSQAGIGCVKFQSYKSSKLAAPESPAYWDTSKETTTSQSMLLSFKIFFLTPLFDAKISFIYFSLFQLFLI